MIRRAWPIDCCAELSSAEPASIFVSVLQQMLDGLLLVSAEKHAEASERIERSNAVVERLRRLLKKPVIYRPD
jgi:hypothetical protein